MYFTTGGLGANEMRDHVPDQESLEGVLKQRQLVVRLHQGLDAADEVVKLGRRHLAQGRGGHLDQGKPSLGSQALGVRDEHPGLTRRGGQGVGIQPGKLGSSNRFAGVEQEGEDHRLGAQRIAQRLRERLGHRFLEVGGIVDVGLIEGPHPRDGPRGGEAENPGPRPAARTRARGLRSFLRLISTRTCEKSPLNEGSIRRIRSTSGGCVDSRPNSSFKPLTASPKNMWLASSAWGSAMREPAAKAPIFLRAPAMPSGIARELHGRCVGEKLALARHGRLDQVAEKHARRSRSRRGPVRSRGGG